MAVTNRKPRMQFSVPYVSSSVFKSAGGGEGGHFPQTSISVPPPPIDGSLCLLDWKELFSEYKW